MAMSRAAMFVLVGACLALSVATSGCKKKAADGGGANPGAAAPARRRPPPSTWTARPTPMRRSRRGRAPA